jgi:hypothetical protein
MKNYKSGIIRLLWFVVLCFLLLSETSAYLLLAIRPPLMKARILMSPFILKKYQVIIKAVALKGN